LRQGAVHAGPYSGDVVATRFRRARLQRTARRRPRIISPATAIRAQPRAPIQPPPARIAHHPPKRQTKRHMRQPAIGASHRKIPIAIPRNGTPRPIARGRGHNSRQDRIHLARRPVMQNALRQRKPNTTRPRPPAPIAQRFHANPPAHRAITKLPEGYEPARYVPKPKTVGWVSEA
jgi:hypothetical protein